MRTFIVNISLFYILSFNLFAQEKKNVKQVLDIDTEKLSPKEVGISVVNSTMDSSKIGVKFIDFEGNKIDGEAFSSIETKDIVFYNFWKTSCLPCIEEIPLLNKLATKYNNKIDFIAVTYEDRENIKSFLKQYPFNFSHIFIKGTEINRLEIIRSYPTNVIVYKGRIIYCQHGGTTKRSKFYDPIMKAFYKKYVSIIDSLLK